MTHDTLLICLGELGVGEAALGLSIAEDIKLAGGEPLLIISPVSAPIFMNSIVLHEVYSPNHISLLLDYIESNDALTDLESVIFCDIFANNSAFRLRGLDWNEFAVLGTKNYAINTWDFTTEAQSIDLIGHSEKTVHPWPMHNTTLLDPVPFTSPSQGKNSFNALPVLSWIGRKTKKHIHSSLGLPSQSKLILFCTSPWQHLEGDAGVLGSISRNVPDAVIRKIIDADVNNVILHIGPKKFERLDGLNQYFWIGTPNVRDFTSVLGSSDLLLSLNYSARTATRAVALGTPVLYVSNSFSLPSATEMLIDEKNWSKDWLEKLTPCEPFRMWPLGFSRVIDRMMVDNPYTSTMLASELGDVFGFMTKLNHVLYDAEYRNEHIAKQQQFVSCAQKLPRPSDLLR